MNGALDYCYIGTILVIAIFSIIGGMKVIPEYQRLVVFRLGRPLDKPKGPGLVFLIPVVDRAVKVDLREQKREVLDQMARTKDGEPVLFSYCCHYKVLDPVKSVLEVGNHEAAAAGMTMTTFRALIGSTNSVDITKNIESMNSYTRTRVDEITERWGVKTTNIEILKIVVDDHQKEMDEANFTVGTFGETQTTVHTSGTVLIGEQSWDAISSKPIPPKSKVRVKRVILEVEDAPKDDA